MNIISGIIKTEEGFPICKVVQMPNGEPGLQVQVGNKYVAIALWDFLNEYCSRYKAKYGN